MSGFTELSLAAQAAHAVRPHVALALATLVRVEGSSYRQPGARMLVDAEHRVLAGAISGGCLEADVAARAEAVCASGVTLELTYDLRDDLQAIWGFGSACDGVAHILLEPLRDVAWLAHAADIRHAREGGAIVSVIETSATGGTIALLDGGAHNGAWHAHPSSTPSSLLHDARRLVDVAQHTARPVLETLIVDERAYECFVEPLMPSIALHLIGAGRGAEAFARIATTLGWDVTLIDHRPALLEALVLPASVRTACVRADDGAALITRDARTAVALLSHMFEIDREWMMALLPLPIGYLGVLGSRQRAAKLIETVAAHGVHITPRMHHMLYAPIGLDLGGETPESIALAAIAEIEAVMHGRPGGALRERESAIH